MEEVVAHPGVPHRGLGADRLEGGMGADAGHRGEPAGIGDAEHAHLPIVVGDVLHQPVDRVVRVGALVGAGGARVGRPVHVEAALRAVAATDILHDPDVALDSGSAPGAIGSTSHQDRERRGCAPGRHDHRKQVDAVAGRDHRFGADERRIGRWLLCLCAARRRSGEEGCDQADGQAHLNSSVQPVVELSPQEPPTPRNYHSSRARRILRLGSRVSDLIACDWRACLTARGENCIILRRHKACSFARCSWVSTRSSP